MVTARQRLAQLLAEAGPEGVLGSVLARESGANQNLSRMAGELISAGLARRSGMRGSYRYHQVNGRATASIPAPARTKPAEKSAPPPNPEGIEVLLTEPCRYLVDRLLATGLFGRTVEEVVHRLMCEALRALLIDGSLIDNVDALRARGESTAATV